MAPDDIPKTKATQTNRPTNKKLCLLFITFPPLIKVNITLTQLFDEKTVSIDNHPLLTWENKEKPVVCQEKICKTQNISINSYIGLLEVFLDTTTSFLY
jgi:hypothetical protein